MNILVTGAGGLIGSEAVSYFCEQGHTIFGIENNQRKEFFGDQGDITSNLKIVENNKNFYNYNVDIRNRESIKKIFNEKKFDVVIHTAAQPSHDKAASIPFDDFDTNAGGTLNLLENVRQTNKDCIFVHLSTSKVYGDNPNKVKLKELERRYDYDDSSCMNGVTENMSIDHCLHSLFGVSKASADLMVQEYGKYFNIPTVCLRPGCLTGAKHKGVELHGFLNYLVRCCLTGKEYTIYGYKGKQVRDNIHAFDVIRFIDLFIKKPKIGSVYNLSGGYHNSCSMLEAIESIESLTGKKMNFRYEEKARIGDHIVFYADLKKTLSDYPEFKMTKSLKDIYQDIVKNSI